MMNLLNRASQAMYNCDDALIKAFAGGPVINWYTTHFPRPA